MTVVHTAKIISGTIAAGATEALTWNNPPAPPLQYWVASRPTNPSGPHGASTGRLTITEVEHQKTIDHYNGDNEHVSVTIKNLGPNDTAFDLWQTWYTAS